MSPLRAALDAGALDPRQLVIHESWLPPEPLWRVYSQTFGPIGFNGTDRGFARFSPLRRPDGRIVPILYAGTTLNVALMESIFRDVPSPSEGYILTMPPPAAEERRLTRIALDKPVQMVDFSSIGLRRLGPDKVDAIDCNSAGYVDTQALASWVYANTGAAVHGIVWRSKQDDSGEAAVFFEDRVAANGTVLQPLQPGQNLHGGQALTAMGRLADRLGVFLHIS